MDEHILEVLKGIEDPELGVNLVDLGLVYAAERDGERIAVRMTATSRSCPMGEYLREEARTRLGLAFAGADAIDIAMMWTPAWTPERMSAAARAELGL